MECRGTGRPALLRAVRRLLPSAVFGFYRTRAAEEGIAHGRTGAVNRIQRFGSSINCNVHLQALVLDGVYSAATSTARPVIEEAGELFDEGVEHRVETIRDRVLRSCGAGGC